MLFQWKARESIPRWSVSPSVSASSTEASALAWLRSKARLPASMLCSTQGRHALRCRAVAALSRLRTWASLAAAPQRSARSWSWAGS